MAVTALEDNFYDITGDRLSSASYLNLFNLLEDTDKTRYMNIWRSFTINEDVTQATIFYETHEVDNDDWWDNISYYYYGTPKLWWVVAMMNSVMNPFEELEVGTNIKILREEYIYQLLKEMENIQGL
jgi:hypothetical protein